MDLVLLPLPAVWLARAYFRGGVMANDSTAWLSYAGLAHAIVLIGVLAGLVRQRCRASAVRPSPCRRRTHRGGAHPLRHDQERTHAAEHGSRLNRQAFVSGPATAGRR
jgi:hypothetical protein